MDLIKSKIKSGINYFVRQRKVAMFHPGRCGSTVLANMLNAHKEFFWWGEPFENQMRQNRSLKKEETVRIIKDSEAMAISKIYGFETKYPIGMHLSRHCLNMTIPDYVNFLKEFAYDSFILLNRKNHLKRVISMQRGRSSGIWHTMNASRKIDKVHINPMNFEVGLDINMTLVDYFRKLDIQREQVLNSLGNCSLLNLDYEADVSDSPMVGYRKICEFMGVVPLKPDIKLKKTNPFPASELVSNFEEVAQCLDNTPYAWMLYE